MPFYTYNCIINLAHDCDKYETPIRIIYTPTEQQLTSKHFLFHDIEKIDTPQEYGVLGKLKNIYYYKQANTWQINFDNISYEIDPTEKVFMYENLKR